MSLLIFLKPLREHAPFIRRMFLTIDRPEDRPYTLLWIFTQLAGTFAVVVPMSFLLDSMDMRFLLGIPTFVVGFGDGLAEPVGVRFGRHKYQTTALFTDRVYTRSLEGSACVLIASIVAVLGFSECIYDPATDCLIAPFAAAVHVGRGKIAPIPGMHHFCFWSVD